MLRRRVALLALVAALGGPGRETIGAHAGARLTDPVEGATLGDTPRFVRLTFSERPEPALSIIRVLDTAGTAYQVGQPEQSGGDPLTLVVPVRPLERGVYIVTWRIVSGVDGHATAGAYAFGVRVAPTAAASIPIPTASLFEIAARWILIAGLTLLVGAAAAGGVRSDGTGDVRMGGAGWLLATIGLVLLAEAQRRNAAAAAAVLLRTPIGRALVWRAVALVSAGGALLLIRPARPRRAVTGIAALAALGIHVAAGHAAAGDWGPPASAIAIQWAHFAAVGAWLGGLGVLLAGIRGEPSADTTAAVRRFSNIAACGLVVVVVTGAARTAGELSTWGDLIATGYGRTVSVKIALLVVIAGLGALNRWRGVPAAPTSLRALRRIGSGELVLAAGTLLAAAALGALPPPADVAAPAGLSVSGVDFGTSVRVRLTAASAQPGPNRFSVHATDYDSGTSIRTAQISLRFTAVDDPGVAPTTLALAPDAAGAYAGSGANLAFDGRWLVTALIERAGDSVQVPLDVETRVEPQPVSAERFPGQAPRYIVKVKGSGLVRFSVDPEKAGRSQVTVTCWDLLGEDQAIDAIVVTSRGVAGQARPASVRRLDRSRFVAEIDLQPGLNTLAAVARTIDGTRMRARLELYVSGD